MWCFGQGLCSIEEHRKILSISLSFYPNYFVKQFASILWWWLREIILWPPPLKTDAAPWSLLVLFDIAALGICSSLPERGSAQGPTKFTGCQIPWSPFSRHRKRQMSCMAFSSATQLWCKQLSLCFHPRDELISEQLFHVLVHYMFVFAWSRVWEEATSLDSLNALSGPLYWLYTVFATPLVWTIYLRFRLSGIRLEG